MNKKGKKKHFKGILQTTRGGTGYVDVPEFEDDIEIPTKSLNMALDGDRVEIVLFPKVKSERLKGEIINILEKANREFVGRVDKKKGVAFLIPDSRRMYTDIFLPPSEAKNLENNDKAKVKIVKWKDNDKNPEGVLLKKLGRAGEHEVEMQSILEERGIETGFPKEVEREAQEVAKEARDEMQNIRGRLDLRDATTFTIDPDDAKDFDDALSVRDLPNGKTEVGVHIADVSHYVEKNSLLDKEARQRAFSVYLVDRTIPMLPEVLSNDICSLVPAEDRFVFSAIFTYDKSLNIIDEKYAKAIIHSDKRFSYEDAQRMLDNNSGKYIKELSFLDKLSKKLRKEKLEGGAIDFAQDEIKFKLDKKGKPLEIVKKERLGTHKLVEELMLLANRKVAQFIEKKTKGQATAPFIYRIHDKPDPDKIEDLGIYLKALGYDFNELKGKTTSRDIQKLLEKVRGEENQGLIEKSAIRSMAKAVYSVNNIGHFGLGFSHYTHFTSPIRRYSDLLVHRLLHRCLENQNFSKSDRSFYTSVTKELSEKEVEVAGAERDSIKFKQAEYMAEHIGDEFDAQIVGIVNYGLFVQTKKHLAEGLVSVRDLDDDYYELEKERYLLKGKESNKKYQLGDDVRVRVKGADPLKREIDFEIVK